jgi:Ca2+-binding RTX toxin-like protein
MTGLGMPATTNYGSPLDSTIYLLPGPGTVHVLGGSGGNVFKMNSAPASFSMSLDGGSGRNTLDYSAYGSGVTVNLQNGTATGLAGIRRIQNVVASRFDSTLIAGSDNSILIGLGGNDTLQAGSGRDILIGGQGRSTLIGGPNQDIFISGTTAYDTQIGNDGTVSHAINYTALDALMAEWGRTDETETVREQNLTNGGGLNGSYTLNRSPSGGQPVTVTDNSVPDVLVFARPDDWAL